MNILASREAWNVATAALALDKTMGDIDWLQILKWVLVVLAAGFIGQFGKRLADHLLAHRRNRHRTQTPEARGITERDGVPSSADTPTAPDPKTAKKLAKAAAKAGKKAAPKR